MAIVFLTISLLASVIGAICGIGGGIIMKPTLDAFHLMPIATINFMSSCTVLAMSFYSVSKALMKPAEDKVDLKRILPTALGAVAGGWLGQMLFRILVLNMSERAAGAAQSSVLLCLTVGTLLYSVYRDRIKKYNIKNSFAHGMVGVGLGLLSSFLGIGGGPINIVAFSFLFSMDTKEAAVNSLFVILLSQIAGIVQILGTGRVPQIEGGFLLLMIAGGIAGGIVGRYINKKIDEKNVSRLFLSVNVLVICICIYNTVSRLV